MAASSCAAAAVVDSLRVHCLAGDCKCNHHKATKTRPAVMSGTATSPGCGDGGTGRQRLRASTTEKRSANPQTAGLLVSRRNIMALMTSFFACPVPDHADKAARAQPSPVFKEFLDNFDGYTFTYPQNWIPVRGAGADIFFRDPFVLDENISVEMSSPSSSRYKSVEDLGSSQDAGEKVLRQYLIELMSTRLGVRRESSILTTSSRVADDGRLYYQVELNIKSYASNNELAVMPQDRIVQLEWDRRYLSVLGVENNRLYELRLQTPENVFLQEEDDLRKVMDSFRVFKVAA